MKRLRSIAVGIDFSSKSQIALQQAVRIARRHQAELHLVHVIDQDTVEDLKAVVPQDQETFVADLVQSTSDRLMQLLAGTEDLRGHVHVRLARPAAGIIDYCSERQPDLLVLGIRGHNTLDTRAGTQSMRVAKSAPVDTLLVHERAAGSPFGKIAVCTDFSSYSDDALIQGVRIARQDHSAVDLLHVYTPPWQILHYRMPTVGADPDFQRQYRDGLTGQMQGAIQRHADDHPVEPVLIEHFNHADGILEHIKAAGSDLVVIGNRGRSGMIERFLLGSTAERVITEADSSVLVVRAR